jgi:lipoic acid synthetase
MTNKVSVPVENIQSNSTLKERIQSLSKGEYKNSKLPQRKIIPNQERLKKPSWIRAKSPSTDGYKRVQKIKQLIAENNLKSVCQEASCPNLSECFSHGTATFMIMGGICTRKCPFCDVAHGRPDPLDPDEPAKLSQAINTLQLDYVVITSVDRDDLKDGGAQHFNDCIEQVRRLNPNIKIEVLVPDFRRCEELAISIMQHQLPDVFNHNLETVPRLYSEARPGADYKKSLELLQLFKQHTPDIPTKSGLMVGLGEKFEEIVEVMKDLRQHQTDMITIGQYLQPSKFHLPVDRYVSLEEFAEYEKIGNQLGFSSVASGPMVRSSYHADLQASNIN